MDAKLVFFKNASTSPFVRATVAFGLFPLPCFLSSRRLHLGTSLDTLKSSSWRMLTFALFSSRNRWILREKEDIASGSYFEMSFFLCSYMKITQQPVQVFRGDFHDLSFFGHTHLEISEMHSYRR